MANKNHRITILWYIPNDFSHKFHYVYILFQILIQTTKLHPRQKGRLDIILLPAFLWCRKNSYMYIDVINILV